MKEKQKVDSTFMKALSEIIEKRRKSNNKSIYLASAESSIAKSFVIVDITIGSGSNK